MKRALVVLGILAAAFGGYRYYLSPPAEFIPEIRTVVVTVGDVADTVGATGALEAVTTVQVGSQVSGIIQDIYVDYNAIVHEGDVIMRLDPSLFETQIAQARANLIRAEAEVERSHVAVDDARTQLARAEDLSARDLISTTELEAAQVNLRSAQAQLKSTEAQVIQAEASLNQNEVNLEHTVIRAPIDGIVISRLVDVGQTVAASLQAPELFIIAADLTKMRVIANIDESDVGRIRPHQRVTFSVDAYPEESFEGAVSQIRLEPVVQQNVVTYATVVDAPNPDLKLKPGMTATITLEVARRDNIVRIPNAALRFRPTPETFTVLHQPAPESRDQPMTSGSHPPGSGQGTGAPSPTNSDAHGPPGGGAFRDGPPDPEGLQRLRERMAQMSDEEREAFRARRQTRDGKPPATNQPPRRPGNTTDTPAVPAVERGATTIDALFGPLPQTSSSGQVWLLTDGTLNPLTVTLGVTDGSSTELLDVEGTGPPLTEGTELVSFISTPEEGLDSEQGGGSPLIPQFGRRRR